MVVDAMRMIFIRRFEPATVWRAEAEVTRGVVQQLVGPGPRESLHRMFRALGCAVRLDAGVQHLPEITSTDYTARVQPPLNFVCDTAA